MKNKILYHSIGSVILSNAKNLDTCTADANRSFAPLRMTRMGAWMTMTMAALALAFTACSEEDIMQPANGQSGSLHISSVIIDGQQVARSRVVADNGGTYNINDLPANHSITGFSEGDEIQLYYSFEPVSWDEAEKGAAEASFDGSSWTIADDEEYNGDDVINPHFDYDEKWKDVKMYASVVPASAGPRSLGRQAEGSNTTLQYVLGDIDDDDVLQVTDCLYASTEDGSITVDTDLNSPTLGATTIEFKHQDALLRLAIPESGFNVAGTYVVDGTAYNVTGLATLWAFLDDNYFGSYVPFTQVGNNLQAIVYDTYYTLAGFKAVLYTTASGKPGDENYDELKVLTLDLPFKVGGLASEEGIELEENTQYPLTLTLSPNQAQVNLASATGKPGWAVDVQEHEFDNSLNDQFKAAMNELKFVNVSSNVGTFEVYGVNGLMVLNKWMTGSITLEKFKSLNFVGSENVPSSDKLKQNIKLMVDITLVAPATGGSNWTAIGTAANPYTGTIDGNGKTLDGMVINATEHSQGFVGYLGEGGQIKNLSLAGAEVTSTESWVGIVAGKINGASVENCYTAEGSSISGAQFVGGIVGGATNSTIAGCINAATVQSTGGDTAGVVGNTNNSIVILCGNTGEVSATGCSVGGIVGYYQGESAKNIASWTINTTEIDGFGNAAIENDGIGEKNVNIIACYSVADVAALNSKLDKMNEALWQYYKDNSASTGFFWKETTDNWPTTVQHEVSGENPFVPDLVYHSNTFEVGKAKGLMLLDKWMNNGITTNDFKAYGFEGANDITAEAGSDEALAMNITFMVNITLDAPATTGGSNWIPIGTDDNSYTGTIDGNGKTLGGMVINATKHDHGFVRELGTNGQIKNLTFADAQVTSNNFFNAGIVAGYNYGIVENCHTIGDSSVNGYGFVGGIVGNNGGTITNCTNAAEVVATNERSQVGGITGVNGKLVSFCINSGSVSGGTLVGGIVGEQYGGDGVIVIACGNTGLVSGSTLVGGIVGLNNIFSNAIASWTITTAEMNSSGPTLGTKDGFGDHYVNTITACYSVADATALDSKVDNNSKVDYMNIALWNYYDTNNPNNKYYWTPVTNDWPTLTTEKPELGPI